MAHAARTGKKGLRDRQLGSVPGSTRCPGGPDFEEAKIVRDGCGRLQTRT